MIGRLNSYLREARENPEGRALPLGKVIGTLETLKGVYPGLNDETARGVAQYAVRVKRQIEGL